MVATVASVIVLVFNHGKFSKIPEEEIAMTTLDVMIHSYLPFDTIDLLKLDVEGQVWLEGGCLAFFFFIFNDKHQEVCILSSEPLCGCTA